MDIWIPKDGGPGGLREMGKLSDRGGGPLETWGGCVTREGTLGDQGKHGVRVGSCLGQRTLGIWAGWCGRQLPRDRDPWGLGETKGAPNISSLHSGRTGPCRVLQPRQAAAPNLPLIPMFCCCSWCPSSASTTMSRCCRREPPPSTATPSACSCPTRSTSWSSLSSTTCSWADPTCPPPHGPGTGSRTTGHPRLCKPASPNPRTASLTSPGAHMLLFPSISC